MNGFYESIATEFESQMGNLRPSRAYVAIRDLTHDLVRFGFAVVPMKFAVIVPRDDIGASRNESLLKVLEDAYGLYARSDRQKAFEIARGAAESAEKEGDLLSAIDAVHLLGRIHFDVEAYAEASACFAEEMDRSQQAGFVPAFARAVHESSRVQCKQYDLFRAEFGFRFALDFYVASSFHSGQPESDVPGSDWQNIQAAIRCLRSLSDLYGLMADGPVEAKVLIEKLASPLFSTVDGAGFAFLETRYLATACLASIPRHERILARMINVAKGIADQYPTISACLIEESKYIAAYSEGSAPTD